MEKKSNKIESLNILDRLFHTGKFGYIEIDSLFKINHNKFLFVFTTTANDGGYGFKRYEIATWSLPRNIQIITSDNCVTLEEYHESLNYIYSEALKNISLIKIRHDNRKGDTIIFNKVIDLK